MLPEQAIEISKVRFDHAKECLRDAKLLLAGESYRSAANRAYYAIFHAMRGLPHCGSFRLQAVDMPEVVRAAPAPVACDDLDRTLVCGVAVPLLACRTERR